MKLTALVCFGLITLIAALSPVAHAQTFSVLYTFTDAGENGIGPQAGVTIKAGQLFGTTAGGGIGGFYHGSGTVFQMTRVGSSWSYSPIFLFPADGSGGSVPKSRVVFGPDGHLYGTTVAGGGSTNYGVVFDLIPPLTTCKTANCSWKENVLYAFTGYPSDGSTPHGDLIWDQQGNIYGTTDTGGPSNFGTVYEMMIAGSNWTETPIHSFTSAGGIYPSPGVSFDNGGNLVGTTFEFGAHDCGTVFQLTYVGGTVGWVENTIYDFQNGTDGCWPRAGLISDSAGNLYGTTSYGGIAGGGTVFELVSSGDTYSFKLLYGLGGYLGGPQANLALDAAGNLYGTTYGDGAYNHGNVFKLTNTPNGWVYTSLHDFTSGSDGANPASNVTIDTDGTIYGTATFGGYIGGNCYWISGCGTVWMIKP